MRDFQSPGRSAVRSRHGMAATSHPLSTLTAIEILKAGGTAMDAAIAACAVQGVVEPQMTGIGGDCFMLYAPSGSDRVIAYNGSGRAPAAATPEALRKLGHSKMPQAGVHSVTVPGAVEAWARLAREHGRLGLGRLLEPAIRYAEEGVAITERTAFDWERNADTLRADPNAAEIFLPVPRAGDIHRQPKLAETLRRIAKDGPAGFYRGAVAEDIVAHLRSLGGLHTLEDFAAAEGQFVEPISTEYRGHRVWECPPNGQGIIALIILNILSGFEHQGTDPLGPERLHRFVEAARLAYRDRSSYLADPDAGVPAKALLSAAHADALRKVIRLDHAHAALPPVELPQHKDTVYLCVVDSDRNAVSFINSVFAAFGSGVVAPKSGVLLHNRGSSFVLQDGHPNVLAPRKRPMHTIIPGMVTRAGKAMMPFGVMGGHFQAIGHAWLVSNIVDYGMDAQAAIDCPRIFPYDGAVSLERGIPEATAAALGKLGHPVGRSETPHGGSQAIMIDPESGVLTGGSDPRKDGCALGW